MDIYEAFRKIRIVQDEYRRYTPRPGPLLSVDDLTQVVRDYSELDIIIRSVGFDHKYIWARLSRYDDKAYIDFSSGLNTCQRRYAVVKELSQLVIDTEDSFTKDFAGLVAGLAEESLSSIDDEAQQSEDLAHFAACEFLMPYEYRDRYIRELAKGETTAYKVALHHRMPEVMVKRMLYPRIHAMIGSIMSNL